MLSKLLRRRPDSVWDKWQNSYNKHNYRELSPADRKIADFIVKILGNLLDEGFQSVSRAADVGPGGGIRGLMIGPLVADYGQIDAYDVGRPQLRGTWKALKAAARGRLGKWQQHQDAMAHTDRRWQDSFVRAAKLATKPQRKGILQLPRNAYGAIHTGHCPESATDEPATYEAYMQSLSDALQDGGILVMPYVIGSTGYSVGEGKKMVRYPAVAAYPEDHPGGVPEGGINIHEVARRAGLTVLDHIAVEHDAGHSIRPEGDTTTYWGLGAFVFQKACQQEAEAPTPALQPLTSPQPQPAYP